MSDAKVISITREQWDRAAATYSNIAGLLAAMTQSEEIALEQREHFQDVADVLEPGEELDHWNGLIETATKYAAQFAALKAYLQSRLT